MKNSCLNCKVNYIISSVSKFLSVSSRIQRPLREKEGYLSVNVYDNEKHQLEVKLKEILEGLDLPKNNSSSPLRVFDNDYKLSAKNELKNEKSKKVRLLVPEKSIKSFVEANTGSSDKLDYLKSTILKLENEKKIIKSKYLVLKKEARKTSSEKTIFMNKVKENKNFQPDSVFKNMISGVIKDFVLIIEGKFSEIIKKLQQKEEVLQQLKKKFKEGLENNLNSLITMNEQAEIQEKKRIEEYKSQIENLEYVITQNKNYSDRKIQELEESITEYENSKKGNLRVKKSLEEEILKLTKEFSRIQKLEETITNQKLTISNLEKTKENQGNTIKDLQKLEVMAQQYKFERDILEQENNQMAEKIVKNSKEILEIQQEMQRQAVNANQKIEEIVFEKNKLAEEVKKIAAIKTEEKKENLTEKNYFERLYSDLKKNFEENLAFHEKEKHEFQEKLREDAREKKKKSEEIEKLEKKIIFMMSDKEVSALELKKDLESYQNLEKTLKTQLKLSESTPASTKNNNFSFNF